jgi:hypothetical protein
MRQSLPGAVVCLLSALLLCHGCADDHLPGCQSDRECKGTRICVEAMCMFPEDVIADDDDEPSGTISVGPVGRVDAGAARDAGADARTDVGCVGCTRDAAADAGPTNAEDILKVAVNARAIVADAERGRLYATVGGSDPMYPNRLVTIDVESGALVHSVAVGSEPTTLAMSDDASTLWVSLSGAFSLREVVLSDSEPVPGAQIVLPSAEFGDLAAAGPMVVLPGTQRTLAISLHRAGVSPSFAGVIVMDEGTPRAKRTSGHTGASRLAAGPDGYLFGFNNLHTGFGFYSISVAADGVTQTEHSDLVNGFDTDIVYGHGYVYASSGEVVDVSTPDQPRRAGKFPSAGSVVPLPDAKALVLSGASSGATTTGGGLLLLRLMDTVTFTQVDSASLGTAKVSAPRNVLLVPPRSLAFIDGAAPSSSFGTPSAGGPVYLVKDVSIIP